MATLIIGGCLSLACFLAAFFFMDSKLDKLEKRIIVLETLVSERRAQSGASQREVP